jgi:hypothetical protein
MATVLRAALPLASVPEHAGKCLELCVLSEDDQPGGEGEAVWAEVEPGGGLHSCVGAADSPSGWGRGKVGAWISAILEGRASELLVGGDQQLVGDCVAGLSTVLWRPEAFG